MEDFANELKANLTGMSDLQKKGQLEEFIDVFFNRKSSNNALLLGCDNTDIIQNMLGVTANEFINDEKSYLIRIQRVNRPDKEKITISFKNPETEVPFEEREKYKKLFQYYGNDNWVTLDHIFDVHRSIPNLVIKDGINGFLDNRHETITTLSANKSIRSVTICSSLDGDDNLTSSINDLFIIPRDYYSLVLDSADFSDNDTDIPSTFWDVFKNEVLDNIYGFNFIILNNVNDHLIRIYKDLIDLYVKHFDISTNNSNLLRRVFFVNNSSYLKGSRATEEMLDKPLYDLSTFLQSPDNIVTNWKDVELYAATLSSITVPTELDELSYLTKFEKKFRNSINSIMNDFHSTIRVLIDDIKTFPNKYDSIGNYINELEKLLEKKDTIREDFLAKILDCSKEIIDFTGKYCPCQKEIACKCYDDIANDKEEYTKKTKKLLGERYDKSNKDFKDYILEKFRILFIVWKDTKNKLDLKNIWREIDTIGNGTECILKGLDDQTKNYASSYMYNYGAVSAQISSNVKKSLEELESVRASITFDELHAQSTVKKLEAILTGSWDNTKSANILGNESHISSLLQNEESLYGIKKLLLDKMNSILAQTDTKQQIPINQ